MTDVFLPGNFLRTANGFTFADSAGVTWSFDTATNKVSLAITAGAVGSFDEAAQDAVFNVIADSATIDVTYNDAGNSFSLSTIAAGILAQLLTVDGAGSGLDADLLDGLSSAAFALAATTVTAGGGLTGSGTLGTALTLAVGAGTGITVNADDVAIDQAFTPTWTGVHTFNDSVTMLSHLHLGAEEAMTVNGVLIHGMLELNSDTHSIQEVHTHSATDNSVIYFARSRGTTATPTVVQSGDYLGVLYAVGYDGTDYALGAGIGFIVDGTPGSNDMPTAIVFSTTPDGTQGPVEALRLKSDQTAVFSGAIYGAAGAVGTPSLTFSGDTNTGLYSLGADQLGLAVGGTAVGYFSTASLILTTASAGLELGSTTGTGTPFIDFHSSGAALDYDARFVAGGDLSAGATVGRGWLTLQANHLNIGNGNNNYATTGQSAVVGATGTTDAAALSYRAYLAYDCYWDGTNSQWIANRTTLGNKFMIDMGNHIAKMRFRFFNGTVSAPWADSAWTDLLTLGSTQAVLTVPLRGASGSAAAPGYAFSADTATGMYLVGASDLGFSIGGTLRYEMNGTAFTSAFPFYAPAGAVGGPAYSFSGDPNTGIYSVGADQLGLATGGVLRLVVETDGRIYGKALHNNAGAVTGATNQYIASGTYTPNLFNTTNVAASTARLCQWIRVGNVVSVSGQLDVDVTSAAATLIGISLPIASALTTAFQLGGVGAAPLTNMEAAAIDGDATNDRAQMRWVAVNTANHTMAFTFTYEVL